MTLFAYYNVLVFVFVFAIESRAQTFNVTDRPTYILDDAIHAINGYRQEITLNACHTVRTPSNLISVFV